MKTFKAKERAQTKINAIDDRRSELEQTEWVPDVGRATVVKVWTYEITDADKVQREYCSPNPGKLQAAVRNGLRNTDGVRVYQKSNVRNTS